MQYSFHRIVLHFGALQDATENTFQKTCTVYIKNLGKYLINRLRLSIIRFLRLPPNYIGDNGCIRAAAAFAVWNQIEGDYLEFGVWQGYSFTTAYHEILNQRYDHSQIGYTSPEYIQWLSQRPRFFAFDSFEGLPHAREEKLMVDYYPGAYACNEEQFITNLRSRNIKLDDIIIVKGFYEKTCHQKTKDHYHLQKAAIVMIDCDLYESTALVLDFLTDIIQQGTILIFDDWFRYKGDPDCGEQRACREWLARNPQLKLIEFWRQGPQAVGFIVHLQQSGKKSG